MFTMMHSMKKTLKSFRLHAKLLALVALITIAASFVQAQAPKGMIDKIIAVVGEKPILYSELQAQIQQIQAQNGVVDTTLKCVILEDIILQKLLLNQAEKDSIEVTDAQVDQELDKKIRFFVNQIGSVEELEKYLGKSITQIKDDFKERIREQLLVQQMQSKLAGEIKVSPAEVKEFYNKIPKDSLPFVESEIQVAQILKKPPVNLVEKERVKKQLEEIRQKILDGKSFSSMAAFYSEDVGSAAKGGELGFVGRGDLVPEFEAAAFELKGKEISPVIESMYGFHIIQLIERRGETINVRHILLSPKPSATDLDKARVQLDSILREIRLGKISFDEAAIKFSDDADSKNNGGVMVNPASGSTYFEVSEMDQNLFFVVDKLKEGEISEPVLVRAGEKKEAYRIVMLRSRTKPHVANLDDDYQKIMAAAENEKREKRVQDWISRKRKSFYVRIDPMFESCDFVDDWKTQ
jgi:peptidyl-prolyl cis-trans isomerase SurA